MEEPMKTDDPLLAPVKDADHREVAGVEIDMVRAGKGRIRRVIYPAGFRWSKHMKGIVGTDRCMHAHVGFIVRGEIEIEYADGCRVRFAAPQAVVIEPGHEGWVSGDGPAVIIEVDFEADTARQFGLPSSHAH
jgi:hypothetical protein